MPTSPEEVLAGTHWIWHLRNYRRPQTPKLFHLKPRSPEKFSKFGYFITAPRASLGWPQLPHLLVQQRRLEPGAKHRVQDLNYVAPRC